MFEFIIRFFTELRKLFEFSTILLIAWLVLVGPILFVLTKNPDYFDEMSRFLVLMVSILLPLFSKRASAHAAEQLGSEIAKNGKFIKAWPKAIFTLMFFIIFGLGNLVYPNSYFGNQASLIFLGVAVGAPAMTVFACSVFKRVTIGGDA